MRLMKSSLRSLIPAISERRQLSGVCVFSPSPPPSSSSTRYVASLLVVAHYICHCQMEVCVLRVFIFRCRVIVINL